MEYEVFKKKVRSFCDLSAKEIFTLCFKMYKVKMNDELEFDEIRIESFDILSKITSIYNKNNSDPYLKKDIKAMVNFTLDKLKETEPSLSTFKTIRKQFLNEFRGVGKKNNKKIEDNKDFVDRLKRISLKNKEEDNDISYFEFVTRVKWDSNPDYDFDYDFPSIY